MLYEKKTNEKKNKSIVELMRLKRLSPFKIVWATKCKISTQSDEWHGACGMTIQNEKKKESKER